MNEWINGCTLDEGKTRNTRTTWTLPSLSLSRLLLHCQGQQTDIYLHLRLSPIYKNQKRKRRRSTRGQQTDWRRRGCGEGVLCRRKWVVTYDHGEEQWVVAIITHGWTFSSLYQCACDSQVGYPLVGQRWAFLISFVFSYFFYFLFFQLIYFSLLFLGFLFNDCGVFSFNKRIVSS
jgi:hypothetical protein